MNKGCTGGRDSKIKNVGCHKNKSPVTEWKTQKTAPQHNAKQNNTNNTQSMCCVLCCCLVFCCIVLCCVVALTLCCVVVYCDWSEPKETSDGTNRNNRGRKGGGVLSSSRFPRTHALLLRTYVHTNPIILFYLLCFSPVLQFGKDP